MNEVEIKDNTILIVMNEEKNHLIKIVGEKNLFYSKIFTIREFMDKYYFSYDENNFLKKSKITTINGKTLEKELVNDSKGNIVQEKDYDNNITRYEYDDKNRIKILNHPNGEVEHYKYDNRKNN